MDLDAGVPDRRITVCRRDQFVEDRGAIAGTPDAVPDSEGSFRRAGYLRKRPGHYSTGGSIGQLCVRNGSTLRDEWILDVALE
jgi:hypothetical protein